MRGRGEDARKQTWFAWSRAFRCGKITEEDALNDLFTFVTAETVKTLAESGRG